MTNPYYTASGNPGTGTFNLATVVRAEFAMIEDAFDDIGTITTTGLYTTTLNQQGNFTFTLPAVNGATIATTLDIAAEATARQAADTLLAPIASPSLTGTPAAPTAAVATNTTQVATTAYVRATPLNLLAPATADVDVGFHRLTGLSAPAAGSDAATKAYVDSFATGLQIKPTAAAATTAALPANTYANGTAGVGATLTANAANLLVVDGVAATVGMKILVKNEATAANNGLYTVTTTGAPAVAYVLTRDTSMDAAGEFSGAFVPVDAAGTTNKNTLWICNPSGTVTVGTTAIPFSQLGAATSFNAGANISIVGNIISLASSPALAGTPTAPTPAVDDSDTSVATTAFVVGQASAIAPLMDSTAAPGISLRYSRQDHVHPSDTSRATVVALSAETAARIAADATFLPKTGGTLSGMVEFQSSILMNPNQSIASTGSSESIQYGSGGMSFVMSPSGVAATYSWNNTSHQWSWVWGAITAVTLTGTGNLGVAGNTTLVGTLFVNGQAVASNTGTALLQSSASLVPVAWTFGISVTANAGIQAQGFLTFSDGRAKDAIRDITADEAMSWVMRGRPRHYMLDGKPTAGFIAQEDVRAGRHEAVMQMPSDDPRFAESDGVADAGCRLSRDYEGDIAYLTKSLQIALMRIAALEASRL